MFDLNESLKEWKRSFGGGCSSEDLEELESHLLEYFYDFRETGSPEEEAFDQAVAQMGNPKSVGIEFGKVRSLGDWVLDRFRALDLPLFLGLLLICGMGLVLLFSVTNNAGAQLQHSNIWIKQAVWVAIGFTLMFIVAQIKPVRLMRCTPFIYGLSILLLVMVLFIGIDINGVRSWFRVGGLAVQPSVLMLVTMPMTMAWLLTKQEWVKTRKGFATMQVLILLPTMLILCQSDLGMALLCFSAGWITLILSKDCRARLIKLSSLALPALCVTGWLLLQPHQLQRITAWLNPEGNPNGVGYQYMQVEEAVSAGGFFGRGWLNAESYVPNQHTDFILSAVAEQFGTVGIFVLVTCFVLVIYRSIVISMRSQDIFCRFLGFGFTGLVCLLLVLNVSMLYGLVPSIGGLPVPLVSYGGSSIVLLLAGFGILASMHSQKQLRLTRK